MPVVAVDQFGRYDPTLVADDVLVLEDGVPQPIRSVRHIPANVLLVLDTGGELRGLGGMSKRTNLTRDIAIELVKQLHEGDQIAVLQFNNKVDLLQAWTVDRNAVYKVLKTKVSSGKRDVFSEAVVAAAKQMKDRPEGSRHVVLITDGVDTSAGQAQRAEAIKQLVAARATVHVISYTEYVRQKRSARTTKVAAGQMPSTSDRIANPDPTMSPGTTRSPAFGVSITFDRAMHRQRKAYEAETRKSQQILSKLTEETGGRFFLPKSGEEMIAEGHEVARDIGAEYVVTYRPKRPLAAAEPGEYRRVDVASRRVGLRLRSRRGYVASPSQ